MGRLQAMRYLDFGKFKRIDVPPPFFERRGGGKDLVGHLHGFEAVRFPPVVDEMGALIRPC